ncbi:MAG: mechanosensitive ion channel family protein [Myxococcota bacterium]|nr:mechanosensitive ion channel family protein [Myxococcota bacterium]
MKPAPTTRDALDRQTPRRTLGGFIKEAREGDFGVAASYLDLRGIADARRAIDGPDLAQKLAYVLERQPTLDLEKVPDVPEGEANAKSAGTYVADTLYAGEEPVPIALTRAHFPDGVDRWLIARSTVERIPMLDATYGPRPVGVRLPASLTGPTFLGNELWQWLGTVLALVVAYAIARALAAAMVRAASYFTRRTPTREDDALVESARRPLRMVVGALVFRLLVGTLQLTSAVVAVLEHGTFTALVIGIAWLLLRGLGVATLWLDEQAGRDGFDVIRGRRVRTQAMLLRRVASVSIAFIAAACLLIQFEFVRNVGVSLLASAGVVSVVVGLAAQKSLAAIIAGIQFSAAQPVRMGDQIVAEGEFGEIEEINLTYAVVRLWDQRRLILPINYFLEKPFQNWTRSETHLLGTILILVDYAAPIDAMRAELRRICESTPLWDERICALQVTDCDGTSATLRALVSAGSAGALWDLRCDVRERLLAFVQSYENGRFLVRRRHVVQASA